MRKTFKLEVKEEFIDGVAEYYFTLPDELANAMDWYPGDTIDWEVNGDSVLIYKSKRG